MKYTCLLFKLEKKNMTNPNSCVNDKFCLRLSCFIIK